MANNCLLCGVGGQGTVLASKLIASSAMNMGLNVKTAETIGMAQRGGCVVSHVRIGDDVYSPLVPIGSADVLIAFEPAEAVRCLPYLKDDGVVIVSKKAIMPVTASLTGDTYNGEDMINYIKQNVKNVTVVDTDEICSQLGSTKVMNVVLLGAAAKSGALGVTAQQLEETIIERLPQKFHQLNIKALHAVE